MSSTFRTCANYGEIDLSKEARFIQYLRQITHDKSVSYLFPSFDIGNVFSKTSDIYPICVVHPIIKNCGLSSTLSIGCKSIVPCGTIIIDNYCNVYLFKNTVSDSTIELEKVKTFSITKLYSNSNKNPYNMYHEERSGYFTHSDVEYMKYQKLKHSDIRYNDGKIVCDAKKLENPLCNHISQSIVYEENIYCAPPNVIDLIKDTFTGLNVDSMYNFYKMIQNFHSLILKFVMEKQHTDSLFLSQTLLQTKLNEMLLNEKLLNEKLLNEKLLNEKLYKKLLLDEKPDEKLQIEELQIEELQNEKFTEGIQAELNEILLNELSEKLLSLKKSFLSDES